MSKFCYTQIDDLASSKNTCLVLRHVPTFFLKECTIAIVNKCVIINSKQSNLKMFKETSLSIRLRLFKVNQGVFIASL